ncbi:MAG: trehalose utilization protein ThuA [Ruminococcaceae bacterium]|nr:trehalose utilization protein ThuA [Oscillospiraceae bacterium]
MIEVVVWNEYRHERLEEAVRNIYPDGIHGCIKSFLDVDEELNVTLASLDDECQGLPDELLNKTDVLLWWGHIAHHEVSDELVEKIRQRVYAGKMGLIVLHSGHHSKVFKSVVGTTGNLSWGRDQKEVVWNLYPTHPIAKGIPEHFIIDIEELYCEPFYIPQPDAVVFGSWYEDGFIFRSGVCFERGLGKVFYFQPGHEYCRSFYNEYVQKIITNAVHWAVPTEVGYSVPDGAPMVNFKVTDEFNS